MIRFVRLAALAAALAVAPFAAAQTVYKVGSTPTGVPFTFLDIKTNTIQGAMVDLITAIGDDAGFKVDVQATPFSALIPSLTGSKIDIISAAMLHHRRAQGSDRLLRPGATPYREGMVVNADDNVPYKGLADLKGATVGVQVGTVYVDFLKKNGEFAEVKVYDSIADMLRDVSLGRIKAGFGDGPIVAYQLSQDKDFRSAKLVRTYEPKMAGSVGIGVRKTDGELLKKINAVARESSRRTERSTRSWRSGI